MKELTKNLDLKNIRLHNRLVLPPMATASAEADGRVSEKILEYYNEKSQGGYLGLIITEHAFVSQEGMANPRQMSIAKDEDVEGLKKLVDVIHKNGSKAIAQISHAGGATGKKVTGLESIAPSFVLGISKINPEREMTKEDIERVVNAFAKAAKRAVEAGFDGVEIHSAHGYLLNQFYSPLTNKREDEYGGCLDNRLRIHLKIIKAVRTAIGEDCLLALRLGACDYMEGGNGIADAVYAAKKIADAGVELLDISGGVSGYMIRGREKEQGYFSDVTEAIMKQVKIPVLLTGGITQAEIAEKLLAEKKADLIGVGRAMLKDSSWAKKALEEKGV